MEEMEAPSSPYSLWSWSTSTSYASSSSRTSSVSTHSATRSPSESSCYQPRGDEPFYTPLYSSSNSIRTSPRASTSTLSFSQSHSNINVSPNGSHSAPSTSTIPDLKLAPSILPFSSSSTSSTIISPPSFSRAPSTSSTTSEFGAEDEELEIQEPPNFSQIAPALYRSSFPRPKNFAFLKTLGLKSVLSFTQEEYPQENRDFFDEEGIKFLQISMPGNKNDGVKVPSKSIRDALAFVLDSENWPLLMHCNKGKHRTGCVVGCLRKLQNWTMHDVVEEYKRFSFPKSRIVDQHCITAFDVVPVWDALVATGQKPDWLEDYRGESAEQERQKQVDV